MAENLVKQESIFTRREWILRYSSPFKSLMFMAGPMIIIMIVNSLYGIIDKQLTLNFAVHEVSKALSGETVHGYPAIYSPNILMGVDQDLFAKQLINVSTQYSQTIITIIQALTLFTSVGSGIRFGQAMGARDRDRMNNVVISGFIQTSILIVISTVILSQVYPYIITSQAGINFDDRYNSWQFALSDEYSQMFVFGIPLLAMSNFFITLLRTEGKVWVVIINNVCCVVLNVIFGIVFMEKLDMGMKGAVYGSMVSWAVSITVSVCVIAISKDSYLRPNFRRFVWSTHDALRIWVVGLSPLLTNIVFAIVSYVSTILITNLHSFSEIEQQVNAWLASGHGKIPDPTSIDPNTYPLVQDAMHHYMFVVIDDGHGGLKVSEHISDTLRIMSSSNPWMTLIYAPIIGMSQGANVNYAYNIGANKRERMVRIYKIQLLINVIWFACAEVLVQSAAKPMMELFCYTDSNYYWFQIYLAPMIFASITFTTISFFQGQGNPKNALIVSIMRSFVIQITFIVIGWAIAKHLSTDGSKDWTMFLMNGLQEIPAAILAGWMFLRTIKNWKTIGVYIDVPDNFERPSIADVVRGEFSVKERRIAAKLQAKIANYKAEDETDRASYEKLVNYEIDDVKFQMSMLMAVAIGKDKIKEAKSLDAQNFRQGQFDQVKVIKEAQRAITEAKKALEEIESRINTLVTARDKLSKAGDVEVLKVKSIQRQLKALHLSKIKVKKAITNFEACEVKARNNYEKKRAYFEAHKDQILGKIKMHDEKNEKKRLAFIQKQQENKKQYEAKLAANPALQEKVAKRKAKIEAIRLQELQKHNERTKRFETIIARREEKAAKKVKA